MRHSEQLSKGLFYTIFVLSIFTSLCALIEIILISTGLTGFNDGNAIQVDCSNKTYFLLKFSQINAFLRAAFLECLFCCVFSFSLVAILIVQICRYCRSRTIRLRGLLKVGLYLTSSLTVLTSIVPAAYFVTFYHELDYCTSAIYDSKQVLGAAIFGMIVSIVGFITWVLLMCAYWKQGKIEERYKEVTSQPTEPNDQDRYQKKSEVQSRQPEYKRKPEEQRRYIHEETRENIHDDQRRSPRNNTYSKDPQNQYSQDHRTPNHESRKEHRPVYEKKESPRRYEPIERQPNQSKNNRHEPYYSKPDNENHGRYSPERSYGKEDRDAELVYHRKKKSPESSKYDEALYKESKQYLGNQRGGRSILNSEAAVSEREGKGSEYFRSGDGRQNQSPSTNKREREGMLLNYIRGKYAG